MKNISKLVASAALGSVIFIPSLVSAQEGSSAAPKYTPPIVCPGYKKGPTNVPGERVGKKITKAYEAYNADLMQEALDILYEIETKDEFDRAYTDRFLGNLLAAQEGKAKEALKFLYRSVNKKVLNDTEHAQTLKLVGDLSLMDQQYANAIKYYNMWMDFTCKEDPDVYTRLANSYYELKQYDKMVEPADKAISLYDKPNQNPYVLKLTSYYERKMFPQTVKVAEELVRVFPEEKRWWPQLGAFYMQIEDYKRALSTFEMAYNQGHLDKKSQIKALAQLYATNDIPYKAATLMEKYLKSGLLDKDETTYSQIANTFHQAKYHKKAAGYYAEAAKLSDEPADLYRKQGVLLLTAEDYKGALAAMRKALDAGASNTGRIYMAMMEASFYSGDMRNAYVYVKEAKKQKSVARNARAWEPYIQEKARNRGITL